MWMGRQGLAFQCPNMEGAVQWWMHTLSNLLRIVQMQGPKGSLNSVGTKLHVQSEGWMCRGPSGGLAIHCHNCIVSSPRDLLNLWGMRRFRACEPLSGHCLGFFSGIPLSLKWSMNFEQLLGDVHLEDHGCFSLKTVLDSLLYFLG